MEKLLAQAPRPGHRETGMSMDAWSVVTGAGSGIGAALARRLGSKGFRVLAVGRRAEKLYETASGCDHIVPCPADVGSREGRERILSALKGEKVRFLVHSAAVGVPNSIKDVKEEDFEDAMRINVTGPLFLNQALLPHLSGCDEVPSHHPLPPSQAPPNPKLKVRLPRRSH